MICVEYGAGERKGKTERFPDRAAAYVAIRESGADVKRGYVLWEIPDEGGNQAVELESPATEPEPVAEIEPAPDQEPTAETSHFLFESMAARVAESVYWGKRSDPPKGQVKPTKDSDWRKHLKGFLACVKSGSSLQGWVCLCNSPLVFVRRIG